MEKCVRDDVLRKVDELILVINENPEYQRFQIVVKQMKNNEEIMSLIKSIKQIQKEIVNLEYVGKDTSLLELKLSNTMETLNSFPVYQEYSYLLSDLNNMFQDTKSFLEAYLNNLLK